MDIQRGAALGKAARDAGSCRDYDSTTNLTPFDTLLRGHGGTRGGAKSSSGSHRSWEHVMPDNHTAITAEPSPAAVMAHKAPPGGLGTVLTVVVLLAWVLALYFPTTISMVTIWERPETFAHGFVVLPGYFLYLLWLATRLRVGSRRDRALLARVAGDSRRRSGLVHRGAGQATVVSQMAMIAMVPFAVWAVLGTRVAAALCIPLAFLFFAVPFGEFLVPTLMDRTADFTVAAIRASGVPVYREGNYFMIPRGAGPLSKHAADCAISSRRSWWAACTRTCRTAPRCGA